MSFCRIGFPCHAKISSRSVPSSEPINAVKAFRDEVDDLIDCGVLYISGPLHHCIQLSTNASARLLSDIAQSARRHGLVYYDPQSETLDLPSSEARNPIGSREQVMVLDERAIAITWGPWTVQAYPEATRRGYARLRKVEAIDVVVMSAGTSLWFGTTHILPRFRLSSTRFVSILRRRAK